MTINNIFRHVNIWKWGYTLWSVSQKIKERHNSNNVSLAPGSQFTHWKVFHTIFNRINSFLPVHTELTLDLCLELLCLCLKYDGQIKRI